MYYDTLPQSVLNKAGYDRVPTDHDLNVVL